MIITIARQHKNTEAIAEQFDIVGSGEIFAVHATTIENLGIGDDEFSATHVGTGMRIAQGETIDGCIAEARRMWASKTPEELAAAIAAAKG